MRLVAHQAAERDGRAQRREVHEDGRREARRAQAVSEVGQVKGIASLDVVNETAERPLGPSKRIVVARRFLLLLASKQSYVQTGCKFIS